MFSSTVKKQFNYLDGERAKAISKILISNGAKCQRLAQGINHRGQCKIIATWTTGNFQANVKAMKKSIAEVEAIGLTNCLTYQDY